MTPAREAGTRARDQLRDGVEAALLALGQGFLVEPSNTALRQALSAGELTPGDYFNELLRLVYRMIFLVTVEERGILHGDDVAAGHARALRRRLRHAPAGRTLDPAQPARPAPRQVGGTAAGILRRSAAPAASRSSACRSWVASLRPGSALTSTQATSATAACWRRCSVWVGCAQARACRA